MNQENLPAVIEASAKAQGLTLTNVNLIMPTETFGAVLGQFDKITIETVRVSAGDPRETYEPNGEGKGFALTKTSLQKIASALSIQWHPQYTGIVESTDKRSRAKAVGIMRKPNGETITQTEEKTIDLVVEEDDLRIKAEKDSEGGKIVGWEKNGQTGKSYPRKEPWASEGQRKDWIELRIKEGLKQKRKFKDELAVTGAKDRVIRAFLALKSTYTSEELSRPLAFPRVTMDTGKMLDDPRMRDFAIGMIGQSTASLYGAPAPAAEIVESAQLGQTPTPSTAQDESPRRVGPGFDEEVPSPSLGSAGKDPFGDDFGDPAPAKDSRIIVISQALADWSVSDNDVSGRAQRILDRGESNLRILEASLSLIKFAASGFLREKGIGACFDALDNHGTDPIILENVATQAKAAYDARGGKA